MTGREVLRENNNNKNIMMKLQVISNAHTVNQSCAVFLYTYNRTVILMSHYFNLRLIVCVFRGKYKLIL